MCEKKFWVVTVCSLLMNDKCYLWILGKYCLCKWLKHAFKTRGQNNFSNQGHLFANEEGTSKVFLKLKDELTNLNCLIVYI